ncbi:uncharacterized protein LOC136084502 isoform X2 [Hydra vulgaris]
MTFNYWCTKINKNKLSPCVIDFRNEKKSSPVRFLVHGQGVFVFQCFNSTNLRIMNADKSNGILIKLTTDNVTCVRIPDNVALPDPTNNSFLSSDQGVYYWVSLDSQDEVLRVGLGEPRVKTAVYTYKFKSDKAFLGQLTTIYFHADVIPLRLLRDPITKTIAFLVRDSDDYTMDDIASGCVMPRANLNLVTQRLYECIRGKKFVLDDDTFPEFSAAIESSITNPSGWCNKRLQEKSREFSPEISIPENTYLRITLGGYNGEAPGIPYVMEIWPVGHYSPIHSHSQANAIIRVLHGSINIKMYPYLCASKSGVEPFAVVNLKKDDATWLSPTLNQTHKLLNLPENTSMCVTIQCYAYDLDDTHHYGFFDYIDNNGTKQQYTPESDMDFIEFKTLMKKEYSKK